MTAREIIRHEYNGARNFMTPRVRSYGRLPWGAYEISEGVGMRGESIYGVSVVQVQPETGRTRRLTTLSKLCHAMDTAREYVADLRRKTATPTVNAARNLALTAPWDDEEEATP